MVTLLMKDDNLANCNRELHKVLSDKSFGLSLDQMRGFERDATFTNISPQNDKALLSTKTRTYWPSLVLFASVFKLYNFSQYWSILVKYGPFSQISFLLILDNLDRFSVDFGLLGSILTFLPTIWTFETFWVNYSPLVHFW